MEEDLFEVFEQETEIPIKEKRKIKNEKIVPQDCVKKSKECIEVQDTEEEEEEEDKIEDNIDSDILNNENFSHIYVHQIETTDSSCLHEVAVPPNQEYVALKECSPVPAKTYPFTLDPFQKESIRVLENYQSLLVSAHTSAGKTVMAEYAIAMSLRDKQRVIYTTPIKALSNQKYCAMLEEFKDVGLMTGDVTINPNAPCLVMTTEILRSMLYRGSEIMREIGWVIFDEIHYMRDKERGVVWEETIILLPDRVHYIFLSATIPNAKQFAEWICHLHNQPCHVIYTDYRPTPLQHYIFPMGGDGLHLVVDENSEFIENNFNTAMNVLRDAPEVNTRTKRGSFSENSSLFNIVKMMMEKNFQPAIVFSFSRKECEVYAIMVSKLDFNTQQEKKLVEEVFVNAMDALSDEDKNLPQISQLLPILKKGIGIHHSGILPILKETIEILFSEGLIKTLFATETFAMGLNMPARTVLFTSPRKFDGKSQRWITSGEYIQMSGRAGRRGLDKRGIVILMIDKKMSPSVGLNMIKGEADPLNSAFQLKYNMVLNLLRVEEINPEHMLEKSFHQFQNYAKLPELQKKLLEKKKKVKELKIDKEKEIKNYYRIRLRLSELGNDLQKIIVKAKYILPFLQPGRLVHVKEKDVSFGWGIVVNFEKRSKNKRDSFLQNEPEYQVDVLMNICKKAIDTKQTRDIKPASKNGENEMTVVPILLSLISQISSIRLYFPEDLRSLENRQSVLRSINEVLKRFPKGLPLLDPIEDMGIKEQELKSVVRKIEAFEKKLFQHPLHSKANIETLFNEYSEKANIEISITQVREEIKRTFSLIKMDELKQHKRVLRRLNFCSSTDVIDIKGRVACEITSGNELVLTELMFNGAFNDLSPEMTAAFLSCFVFQDKSQDSKVPEELQPSLRKLTETAERVAKVSIECDLDINQEEFVAQFKPDLAHVVLAWATGSSFSEIVTLTDCFEGSIIRCMKRLEELIREMYQASKAIGNSQLENKFSESCRKIKRDIIFAASLYL